ncbi:hypothetical protein NVP1028O_13 [Vibrio phage 1.028.O._10N.286.45.B6]|nr:hypothetical protein NVP1028O_13 [Vibrio phage 1.028.O._10N.286.45.B6]AUR90017.1 hypothetical protein NVP1136O_13 [Vibrio phage 1.136.O._10N.261.45.E11]AUR90335.1 hypothetical protein NVP1142O_13 [Vibrio phage 1.142.O._10N.261.49.E11]AUR91131.1 hypothetical protein NVP1156O_13 [Vibrio phage 1.156.O._10N.261.45.A6]AUR91312.1 hypothetical protein NVP1159O_13 [Vibrio phage 1.159.O._10N.261.46.F12]AUR96210.1 hypothetical protein NVP1217O_13 [Vibrio phage 1.217.O._10N.261.45.A1]AUR96260.1 hypot
MKIVDPLAQDELAFAREALDGLAESALQCGFLLRPEVIEVMLILTKGSDRILPASMVSVKEL